MRGLPSLYFRVFIFHEEWPWLLFPRRWWILRRPRTGLSCWVGWEGSRASFTSPARISAWEQDSPLTPPSVPAVESPLSHSPAILARKLCFVTSSAAAPRTAPSPLPDGTAPSPLPPRTWAAVAAAGSHTWLHVLLWFSGAPANYCLQPPLPRPCLIFPGLIRDRADVLAQASVSSPDGGCFNCTLNSSSYHMSC